MEDQPVILITSPGLKMNKVEVATYQVQRLISMADQIPCNTPVLTTFPGLNMNKVEVALYQFHRLLSMADQPVILLSSLHLLD